MHLIVAGLVVDEDERGSVAQLTTLRDLAASERLLLLEAQPASAAVFQRNFRPEVAPAALAGGEEGGAAEFSARNEADSCERVVTSTVGEGLGGVVGEAVGDTDPVTAGPCAEGSSSPELASATPTTPRPTTATPTAAATTFFRFGRHAFPTSIRDIA